MLSGDEWKAHSFANAGGVGSSGTCNYLTIRRAPSPGFSPSTVDFSAAVQSHVGSTRLTVSGKGASYLMPIRSTIFWESRPTSGDSQQGRHFRKDEFEYRQRCTEVTRWRNRLCSYIWLTVLYGRTHSCRVGDALATAVPGSTNQVAGHRQCSRIICSKSL